MHFHGGRGPINLNEDEARRKPVDWSLFRRLMEFLRPYRALVLVGLLLLVTMQVLRQFQPFLGKIAIDRYIADKVQEIGARTIFVTRFPAFRFEQWPEEIRLRKHLTYEDTVALREQCSACAIASPFLTRALFFGHRNEIRYRNQKVDNPFVRGAEPDMPKTLPVFVVGLLALLAIRRRR